MVDEATSLESAPPSQAWRVALEQELLASGTRVIILRSAMVYGQASASPILLGALRYARERGESLVVGAGTSPPPDGPRGRRRGGVFLGGQQSPAGTVLNVAGTAVTGRDLARAISYAAGLGGEIVERSASDFLSALGPLGGALMMDLRLSNFAATQLLGWTPCAPSVLYELLYGTLSQGYQAES